MGKRIVVDLPPFHSEEYPFTVEQGDNYPGDESTVTISDETGGIEMKPELLQPADERRGDLEDIQEFAAALPDGDVRRALGFILELYHGAAVEGRLVDPGDVNA